MKIFRSFFCVCLLCLCGSFVFAGGKKDATKNESGEAEILRVGILNGPTSISAAYIMENVNEIDGTKITFEIFPDPQSLLPRMIRGEIDFAFLPPNIAAKTYNEANSAIVCVGVSGYGNLSLITKDEAVKSLSDLCGKKVSVAGRGATPDYIFRYLLSKNNISYNGGIDGVEMDFSVPNPNIAAMLLSGQIDYAVVPEPFATVAVTRSQSVKRAIDLQKEFSAVSGTENFPLTLMVVQNEFAKKNRRSVKKFAELFSDAVSWTVAHPDEAGVLVEKYELGLAKQIVAKSIPYANFVWKDAVVSKKQIENLLTVFLQFAPESVGGKLPDENFYIK